MASCCFFTSNIALQVSSVWSHKVDSTQGTVWQSINSAFSTQDSISLKSTSHILILYKAGVRLVIENKLFTFNNYKCFREVLSKSKAKT